jgi:hypothetical protein
MSVYAVHCGVLTNVVHLRVALWEQHDGNYENGGPKLKPQEEMTAEYDPSSCN